MSYTVVSVDHEGRRRSRRFKTRARAEVALLESYLAFHRTSARGVGLTGPDCSLWVGDTSRAGSPETRETEE